MVPPSQGKALSLNIAHALGAKQLLFVKLFLVAVST
jgi:hypothetical protein